LGPMHVIYSRRWPLQAQGSGSTREPDHQSGRTVPQGGPGDPGRQTMITWKSALRAVMAAGLIGVPLTIGCNSQDISGPPGSVGGPGGTGAGASGGGRAGGGSGSGATTGSGGPSTGPATGSGAGSSSSTGTGFSEGLGNTAGFNESKSGATGGI